MNQQWKLVASLSPFAARLAKFFVHRGFTLHRCCAPGDDGDNHGVGGVGLAEEPDGTVLVTWCTHSRLPYRESSSEKAAVVTEMVGVFSRRLGEAGFAYGPGPLPGRSIRVFPTPMSVPVEGMDPVDAEWQAVLGDA